MARIIKVPPATFPVNYIDDSEGEDKSKRTVKQENFFWLMLKSIVRANVARMSGVEILEFADLHKDLMDQDGKPTLKVDREQEYEKLKVWVEQFKGWQGGVEHVVAVVHAFREAEKLKEKPPKEKS